MELVLIRNGRFCILARLFHSSLGQKGRSPVELVQNNLCIDVSPFWEEPFTLNLRITGHLNV